jgi:hypothetical protein
MLGRLRIVGVIIAVIGIIAVVGGFFGYTQIQEGAAALQGFSEAQGVTLSYNDEGNLVDRGTEEGALAIRELLEDEWKWPVVASELNPDDPLVNTGTEYMYQMATVAYHTLHGEQNVTLEERSEYDGDGDDEIARTAKVYSPKSLPEGVWDPTKEGTDEDAVFEAGTYVVPVAARYWTEFNRGHPLDGKTREQAWTGTVHGLFAELGVGATTAAALKMGTALAQIAMAFGAALIILGGGLYWAGRAPA